MSAEQQVVLRQLNTAFNGGEEWIDFYDPEVEFEMPPEWPEERTYRGHDGMRRALDLWRENFDQYRWDEERLVEAGDCIVGLYHHRGRIKGTETWVERAIGCLWYVRDGQIVRVRSYTSWDEALRAAGVPE